jgi:outer membrane protein OmpA-like peptidoglycan-associated protein/tetratricopeptide (TPR) repeat protein
MIYGNKIFLMLGFLIACSLPASAQSYTTKKTVSGKLKKIWDKGMQYNLKGEDAKAIKEFEKALDIDPTFIDAQLQWAALHYGLQRYDLGELGFEKVLDIDPNYNKKVYYTLGLAELQQNKFTEAAEHFKAYLESGAKNEALLAKAELMEGNARFVGQALANPVPYNPISLGDNVNSPNSEYLPSITADGKTLVYTVRERMDEDFYVSKRTDEGWSPGQPIEEINTPMNEGAQSISADGKIIFFTDCGGRRGYGSCDLFYSEVKNGNWTQARNVGSPVNGKSWDAQPSISSDKNALYFCSNRSGGYGESDIWASYRQADGSWGAPENLGDVINTATKEQSPFIHPDGQTLYFMSNGHPGMGGYDLYYSRKQADGSWGTPQNLGYPINTKNNEGALIVSLDGKTAYYASDQRLGTTSEAADFGDPTQSSDTDLYQFELYEAARPQPVTYVQANVFDIETKEPLSASVEFIDLETGTTFAKSRTDDEGEFLICLPLGKNYALNVSKEKYLFYSDNFALGDKNNSLEAPMAIGTYQLSVGLQPISKVITDGAPPVKGKPVILKNVFFEIAKADLRPESLVELNRLRQLLEDNPTLNIQINGHTDNVGSDADNLQLSDARAKAVYNYLIENGIDASRLSSKGFGETQPIDTNDTDDGRQKNRRTEFIVVD